MCDYLAYGYGYGEHRIPSSQWAYLHLASARSKRQGQGRGHAQFDREYLANGGRQGSVLSLCQGYAHFDSQYL